jgi:hypothetical protein
MGLWWMRGMAMRQSTHVGFRFLSTLPVPLAIPPQMEMNPTRGNDNGAAAAGVNDCCKQHMSEWLHANAEPLLSNYLDQWMSINATQLLTQISTKQMMHREQAMQAQFNSLQQQINQLQHMHSALSASSYHSHHLQPSPYSQSSMQFLPRSAMTAAALSGGQHSPTGGSPFAGSTLSPPSHTHTLGLGRRTTSPLALTVAQQQQHQQRGLSPHDEPMQSSSPSSGASPPSNFPAALDVRTIMRNRINSQMGGSGVGNGGADSRMSSSPSNNSLTSPNGNGGMTVHRPLGLGFNSSPMRAGSPEIVRSPPSSLPPSTLPFPSAHLSGDPQQLPHMSSAGGRAFLSHIHSSPPSDSGAPSLRTPFSPHGHHHLAKGPIAELLQQDASQCAPGEEILQRGTGEDTPSSQSLFIGTGHLYVSSPIIRETSAGGGAGSRRMSVSSAYSGVGVAAGTGSSDHTRHAPSPLSNIDTHPSVASTRSCSPQRHHGCRRRRTRGGRQRHAIQARPALLRSRRRADRRRCDQVHRQTTG